MALCDLVNTPQAQQFKQQLAPFTAIVPTTPHQLYQTPRRSDPDYLDRPIAWQLAAIQPTAITAIDLGSFPSSALSPAPPPTSSASQDTAELIFRAQKLATEGLLQALDRTPKPPAITVTVKSSWHRANSWLERQDAMAMALLTVMVFLAVAVGSYSLMGALRPPVAPPTPVPQSQIDWQ